VFFIAVFVITEFDWRSLWTFGRKQWPDLKACSACESNFQELEIIFIFLSRVNCPATISFHLNIDNVETWGRFHQHVYEKLFLVQIPKVQKTQSSCQFLLRFWVLHVQKLFIKHWWNWHQITAFSKLAGKIPDSAPPSQPHLDKNWCILMKFD